jgi:hypothetical protein
LAFVTASTAARLTISWHLITASKTFLLPIVIDDTRDDEHGPDNFRELQWIRLPGGETPPAFVERVVELLSPNLDRSPARLEPRNSPQQPVLPDVARRRGAGYWPHDC